MHTEKLSVSLPENLINFIKDYQFEHEYSSRSEVVREALKLLQRRELEYFYYEASKEIDPAFEITMLDGLEDDETW